MKWFEFYLFSQGITEIRYVHFCHVVWDILPTMFLPSRLLCFVIFLTSFTIHRVGLNWWLRCFIFSFALSPSPLLPELRCDVCCYHDYCFLSVFFLWWFGWQLWFFSSAVHNFFHHRHTGSTSDCSLHLVLIDAYRRESLWVVVSVSHCSAVCCLSVLSVESSFIFRLLFPRRPAENISGDCRRLRWF